MFIFWGAEYANRASTQMIGSLLGEGNLELLQKDENHQLLCATDDKSFDIFKNSLNVKEASKKINIRQVKLKEFKYSKPDLTLFEKYTENIAFMSAGFVKMLEEAYEQDSYGSILDPDCIFSENYINEILEARKNKYELLYTCALRQSESKVLQEIKQDTHNSGGLTKISIDPLRSCKLFVRHLHPEIQAYNSKKFKTHGGDPFFIYLDKSELRINSFYCLPCLFDFRAMQSNHLECLKNNAYENEYIFKNLNNIKKIKKLDPKEANVLSLTQENINWSACPRKKVSFNIIKRFKDELKNIKTSINNHCPIGKNSLRKRIFSDTFVFPLEKRLNYNIYLSLREKKIRELCKI